MFLNFDFRNGAKKSGRLDHPLQSYGQICLNIFRYISAKVGWLKALCLSSKISILHTTNGFITCWQSHFNKYRGARVQGCLNNHVERWKEFYAVFFIDYFKNVQFFALGKLDFWWQRSATTKPLHLFPFTQPPMRILTYGSNFFFAVLYTYIWQFYVKRKPRQGLFGSV